MTKKDDQKQRNKEILYSALRLQNHSKKSILSVMQSMGESADSNSIDIDKAEKIKSFLECIKKALELCNDNISTLEKLTKDIDNVSIWDDTPIDNSNNTYNLDTTQEIKIAESTIQNAQPISTESKNEYKENTLIISETTGIVILPFELSSLKEKLDNSKNKYSSIDDIIKKEYSLPIKIYRNPFIARFKESYKLMREKEKSSIKEAFDLGLELMFNYNLHPAIISACKNIDELDIYLDYLDSGEISKFKYFKILFEIPPVVKKAKHGI